MTTLPIMEGLLRATRTILTGLDLQRTLEHIAAEATRLTGCEQVKVVLVDREAQLLRIGVAHGRPAPPNFPCPIGIGLSGIVAQSGEPLFVADCQHDPRNPSMAVDRALGFQTYLGLPISAGGEVVGVLTFNTTEARRYDLEDMALLSTFADHAAIAIQNANLFATERDRRGQLEALRATCADMTRELDLPTLLRLLIQRAVALLEGVSGVMFLHDPGTDLIVPTVWVGYGDWVAGMRLRTGEGIAGLVMERREGLIENAYQTSPHAHPFYRERMTHTAVIAEPFLYRDRVIGAVLVDRRGRIFTEDDRALLRLFAGHAAIAIENARLFREEQMRRRAVEAVQAVSEEIARELDLTVLLRLIHAHAMTLTEADQGTVWLWDEAAEILTARSWHGHGPWLASVRVSKREGVVGTVAAERQGMVVNDFRSSPYATPLWLEHSRHVAVLAEPLCYRDRLVGVIAVSRHDPQRPFQPEDQRLLRLFAAPAAIAIENASLVAQMARSTQELQHARDQLIRTETLRALGQMAAGVAHDLNNMLAAVLGQAELLRLRVRDPIVKESLDVLETAATDGAHVVRRLQDFARQRATLPLTPVDLAASVREAIEIARPRWHDEPQRQGQVIEVQTDVGDLPPILGHATEVREALTNLIANAVDAMPLGGTLTIVGSRASQGVLLAVADTGIGMTEAVRQRVFEPFFTTKGTKGTGLGLSVVYGIMERHKGAIEVQSAPGRGTTFTLRFQAAAHAESSGGAAPSTRVTAPRRILVVDDEATVRLTLVNLLRAAGHTVTEAADGAAAIALLPETPLDLVITDLGMPEVTGWDVARAVKTQSPGLPVVLLTGWGDHVVVEAGEGKRSVDRILGKPCRLDDLLQTISELCPT